jgi:hypothetical protein
MKHSLKQATKQHSERWNEIKAVASGPTILLGMTASMGGFLFGSDTGQISGFLIMTVRHSLTELTFRTFYDDLHNSEEVKLIRLVMLGKD